MAKYKVGDKVRIVSKRPQRYWNPEMDKYLGKTMTVTASGRNSRGETYYRVFEDRASEGICPASHYGGDEPPLAPGK